MRGSLKGFLLKGAVLGTTVMLIVMFVGITIGYEWYVSKKASEDAEQTAQLTYNSLYELMRKGWSAQQLQEFIDANREAYQLRNMAVGFYHSQEDIPNGDTGVRETWLSGERYSYESGHVFVSVYPMVTDASCITCHSYVDVGDVMAVITVSEDVSDLIADARRDTLLYLLFLFPFPIIGAWLISRYLGKRIDESVHELSTRIEKVQKTEDLHLIEMNNIDLTFSEMNKMYDDIKKLATRLRSVVVDKDILEFEVRLLEKFVITNEVVRDWKEHVKILLLEINKVMDVQVIFSLFKVEDEDYVLEVFWLHTPERSTEVAFEKVIRKQILKSTLFRSSDGVSLEINHNSTLTQKLEGTIDEDSISFQTKSLFLEAPRIGGIVGIGVNSNVGQDATRMLVIESILTTLLNVIGSVKAVAKYTKELEYFATRDPLTNLYTQRVFWELLEYEVLRSSRHEYKFAVIVIDLDDFKLVNDLHGHLFGDKYLQEVARIARSCLRKGDVLARYGGDEYTMILPYADQEQAFLVCSRILESFAEFFLVADNGSKVKINASIGVAICPDHAETARELVLVADNMMYKAKKEGKGRIGLADANDVMQIFKTIEDKNTIIIQALEENKIIPYFQPIVDTFTGEVYANEVLMRIDLPQEVMVASDFVELAETMGVISKLDYMLMEKALKIASDQFYQGSIFFNLSPKALIVSDFVPRVRKLVRKYGIDPHKVVFEITERDTVKNLTMLDKFVRQLKVEGFQFAIDDFGSGFSSFQYVKRLPIDIIKIEGEFILSLAADQDNSMDKAIVKSIVTLARELNIKMIAEFVENEVVMQKVKELGIDYVQGYHVGRPNQALKR